MGVSAPRKRMAADVLTWTKSENLLDALKKSVNALEATIWLLSKQRRALYKAYDLYYEVLNFGCKRKSFQKDR